MSSSTLKEITIPLGFPQLQRATQEGLKSGDLSIFAPRPTIYRSVATIVREGTHIVSDLVNVTTTGETPC